MTTDEVAQRLNVNGKTVFRLLYPGGIPYVKLATRGRGALRSMSSNLSGGSVSTGE